MTRDLDWDSAPCFVRDAHYSKFRLMTIRFGFRRLRLPDNVSPTASRPTDVVISGTTRSARAGLS
jgi:hypothetical protein